MDEIYINTNLLELIFNFIDPIKLLKLREVHKSWSLIIDDSDVWKRLCLSDKLKPWANQLIKLKFPILKSEHYKTLSNNQWKEMFQLYKRWNTSFDNTDHMITSWIDLNEIPKDNSSYIYYDLLGEYFAYIISFSGELQLYNINTGERLMEAIYLNDTADTEGIKIWLTDSGNVILLIHCRRYISFWDVNKRSQYETPPILSQSNQAIRDLLRGFNNDVIVCQYDFPGKLFIFQIELNDQDEIILQKILTIIQPIHCHYDFVEVLVENRTISVIYIVEISPDFFNGDDSENDFEDDGRDADGYKVYLAVTVVEFPQPFANSVYICDVDNNYTLEVLEGYAYNHGYRFLISNSIIFMVINDVNKVSRSFLRIIWVEHFGGTKKPVLTMRHYVLPKDFRFETVSYVKTFLNFLFIATDIGNISIYKLKNLENLLTLDLNRLPMIKFPLDGDYKVCIKNLIMTQIDGEPRIVIPVKGTSIYVIRIV